MNIDQIKKARDQAPFKPFTIFMSDQRKFEIKHPDYLWVLPGGRSLGVAHDDGTAEFINPLHITTLKVQQDAA